MAAALRHSPFEAVGTEPASKRKARKRESAKRNESALLLELSILNSFYFGIAKTKIFSCLALRRHSIRAVATFFFSLPNFPEHTHVSCQEHPAGLRNQEKHFFANNMFAHCYFLL